MMRLVFKKLKRFGMKYLAALADFFLCRFSVPNPVNLTGLGTLMSAAGARAAFKLAIPLHRRHGDCDRHGAGLGLGPVAGRSESESVRAAAAGPSSRSDSAVAAASAARPAAA